MPFNPDIQKLNTAEQESSHKRASFEEEKIEQAPEGWLTTGTLAKKSGYDYKIVKKKAVEYRETHPHWFKECTNSAHSVSIHYHPDLVKIIEARLSERPEIAPEGWMTVNSIARELGVSENLIIRIANQHKKLNTDWFNPYLNRAGRESVHYHPELVSAITSEINSRPEQAPEGWMNTYLLCQKLKVSYTYIQKYINKYQTIKPEWFHEYTDKAGRITDYYHPELVSAITSEINSRPEQAPEGWLTKSALSRILGSYDSTIGKIAETFRSKYPDYFQNFLDKSLTVSEHYHPELVSAITSEINSRPEQAPEGWLTHSRVAKKISFEARSLKPIVTKFRSEHPEWFQDYTDKAGKVTEHYHPVLIEALEDLLNKRPSQAPEGWLTRGALGRVLEFSHHSIQQQAEKYRSTRPEWFQSYKDNTNKVTEHYHPALVEQIYQDVSKRKEVGPSDWLTSAALAKELSIAFLTCKNIADQYRSTHPEWFRFFKSKSQTVAEHYHPDLIQIIREEILKGPKQAPEGWLTNSVLGNDIRASKDSVRKRADSMRKLHPEWFDYYKDKKRRIREYYHPNLVEEIKKQVYESRGKIEKQQFLEEGLEKRFQNKEDISNIQKTISLFGSSQSLDILYALHPEYKGVPIEKVKSMLAEYLGDYLLTPAPFSLENLKGAEALFGAPSLMEGLSEVIKRDALEKILAKRESGMVQNIALFREYFDNLRIEARNIGNTDLMETILAVEKFYISILSVTTPEGMVASLKEGREFPDIYQRINIREIESKKRLLIADEMGAGKSASAILAKEYLGVEIALVVVPSNAMDTWAGYLSDKVDENGKQVGYFQEQPKVLRVTDIRQLEGVEKDKYDYIVISHERLTAEYTEALEQLDYGMLIVDEVHKLKNIETGVRAEHLLRLAGNKEGEEKYVAMLSGTPVPNKVEDVAMLLKLMYPERFSETDSRTLTRSIIHGDLLDLRQLLLPRLQMKNLGEHIEMPTLTEQVSVVELTPSEEEIYQILLDEDELTPTEKMQMLQKFLLNPKLLDITPGVPSSKLEMLKGDLESAFEGKEKVVLFVNDYISNVIRGEDFILEGLSLPQDIEMRVIHGGISSEERAAIQEEFQRGDKKMLLVVSGKTADVAVDYSAGQKIIFYNEPWTIADKHQQQARVYRPGIIDDVESRTILTKGTIEEGKHEYIQVKHRAIEKLLRGIPITEIEMELLEKSEDTEKADLSVNPELAEYYFSSFEKMNRIFASVKEIGEKKFSSFLEKHGAEYADCYRELGSRSYQSNASRVVATVIEEMVQRQGVESPRILDLASGPEMLRRHSTSAQRANIVSLDINPEHFANKTPESETIVGSFTDIPLAPESVDYINLSLALHYTKLVPSKGEYERLEALREMSRVLKTGGRAVVNMIYSLDFLNEKTLTTIAKQFGLRVVDEYSGEVSGGAGYHSRIITFEKSAVTPESVEEVLGNLSKEDLNGLKLKRTDVALKDSRKVLSHFTLGDKEMQIRLNEEDETLAKEEASIFQEVEALKVVHGSVQEIPRETIIERGFVRIRTGKNKYILFKKIPGVGAVITR